MSVIEFKCGRKHTRYKVSKEIELFVTPKGESSKWLERVKGSLRDISETGLGIMLEKEVSKDDLVVIDFYFSNTRITTKAKVVYVMESQGGYFSGLELEDNALPIMAFIKAKDINLTET